MSSTVTPISCKWCGLWFRDTNYQTTFENTALCNPCHAKAVHAAQNPKLCSQCSNLLTKPKMIKDLFSDYGCDHSSASYLIASSEDGCGMCRMMWLQDPNSDLGRLQFTAVLLHAERPEGVEGSGFGDSVGDINLLHFSSLEDQFRLDMSVSALPNDPAAKFVSQRPPEESLGNESTNQLIRGWLDECLKTHPESLASELPHLPTRVVDVGVGPNPEVKLFETPADLRAHYVTLSYCWGRPRFLTTLLENVEEHKKGLDVATLPLTFKDAIATTRDLGFRYVWIDALCIIQDSLEDKIKEIGKMGDVYNDSTLTIAVVGATAVAEGFLKTKVKQFVDLPYKCPDGTMGSVRVSPRKESDLWDDSLYTRAWCLQENLLSPRLLLYTDTEVIWQCQTSPMKRPKTSHVSYVRENPQLGRSPFSRLPANVLKPVAKLEDAEKAPSDAERYEIWRSLVENYTRRNLTVASDRLPALEGIAKKFEVAWKDNYLAGIWERQLLPSLSWRRSTKPDQPHYPALAEYRAPSWSWASIDGPVEFDTRFDLGNARGMQAKVHSCIFDMDSKNKDAIVIEGYMIPVAQSHSPDEDRMAQLYMDDHADDGRWPLMADTIGDFDDEMKRICYRLLLGEGRDGAGKMMRTTALVIMQASGEDEDTFTRIGLWRSSGKGSSKHWARRDTDEPGVKVHNKKRVVKII